MKLFVGNLPWSATNEDIRDLFAPRDLREVKIITDRETGRSRGFAFVTLSDTDGADAINTLHSTQFMGRCIVVNEANDQGRRSGGGGGGGGGNRNNYRNNDNRGNHDTYHDDRRDRRSRRDSDY